MKRQYDLNVKTIDKTKNKTSVIIAGMCVAVIVSGCAGFAVSSYINSGKSVAGIDNTGVEKNIAESVDGKTKVITTDSADDSGKAEDASVENYVSQYAFDIDKDDEIFEILNAMSNVQIEAQALYADLKNSSVSMPDWGPIISDIYDMEGNTVVDYHTNNNFPFPIYENQVITDVVMLSSNWYYDLSESSYNILNRLFDYTADESVSDLYNRLEEESSNLLLLKDDYSQTEHLPSEYDDVLKVFLPSQVIDNDAAQNAFDTIKKNHDDRATMLAYYDDSIACLACFPDAKMSKNIDWFVRENNDDGMNRIVCMYEPMLYTKLYGEKNDSEEYIKMCQLVDEYNSLRMKYMLELGENIMTYIDAYK